MLRSPPSSGFTLIEIMIVITMIIILIGSGIFPFTYYMDRARAERTLDRVSQEWIIAHQNIRGGMLHDGGLSHAHLSIGMRKGDGFITYSTFTGGSSTKKEYKRFTFDKNIMILGFTGGVDPSTDTLMYHISPPFATGAFSTGTTTTETFLTGVIMTIGYTGATRESGRARDILLRPYFD